MILALKVSKENHDLGKDITSWFKAKSINEYILVNMNVLFFMNFRRSSVFKNSLE